MSTVLHTIHDEPLEQEVSDRRRFLTRAGVAAAVGAVAGLSSHHRAAADDGGTFLIGVNNSGPSTTSLTGGSTLAVDEGTSLNDACISVSQSDDGGAFGVYATTSGTSSKVAVQGENSATYGNALAGFNFATNGTGVMAYNNGSSGSAIHAQNTHATGHAVRATNSGAGGYAVYASATALGATAVNGQSSTGTGVLGQSLGGGSGVHGYSALGTGVAGQGATFDFSAMGTGVVLFSSTSTQPSGTPVLAGELCRDAAGVLHFAVDAAHWREIAGPATAGAFHAITPTRVYDSRTSGGSAKPLATGSSRTVSVATKLDEPATTVVPAGATAVAYTLTAANTVAKGWLAVTEGGTTGYTASTINWTTATNIANSSIVAIDGARQIKVYCGGVGAEANFIVDITGYYR